MKEVLQAFRDLKGSPRALWYCIAAFAVGTSAYFGVLTLMVETMHSGLGASDEFSGITVSIFTAFVTLFMLGAGSAAEKLSVRKGILLAIALAGVGRLLYSVAPWLAPLGIAVVLIGLFITAIGEGIFQPATYAAVKYYTTEKTSSMGYALIYAFMNLGIFLIGTISPLIRVPVEKMHTAGFFLSGVSAVNLTCTLLTVFCFVAFASLMTAKVEAAWVRPPELREREPKVSLLPRLRSYFVGTKEAPSPFRDARFLFFIFMLLPVRTLFAHQWLTLPTYILRAYDQAVADRMEWLVNWVNPGVIFFGTPLVTALTRKVHVYKMMIIGTLVSALPTFLLCMGPKLPLLISYLVIFSVGEALWQPRFLEYASEIAPAGRVAQYMGLANLPWILAKATTGLYSGRMLASFVPEHGPENSQVLWMIYGLIAVSSPIGLVLGYRWVMQKRG